MPEETRRRRCATMEAHFHHSERSADYRAQRRSIEASTTTARRTARTTVLRIPVVVHVLYSTAAENISEAQIASQLRVLNQDFRMRNDDLDKIPAVFRPLAADAMVEFELAVRGPDGLPTSGITRTQTHTPFAGTTAQLDRLVKFAPTGHPAWPREDYLNIWVAPLRGGLLGYAAFPGLDAELDGVVVLTTAFGTVGHVAAPFNLGRTTTHECGHWMNLLHIWGDDGGLCSRSDNVSDTPNQGNFNEGKPSFPRHSCANEPNGDMFMNYMDYVDDDTMHMFTRGQVARMNATLAGPRASLAFSKGLVPVGAERLAGGASVLKAFGPAAAGHSQAVFDGVDWVTAEQPKSLPVGRFVRAMAGLSPDTVRFVRDVDGLAPSRNPRDVVEVDDAGVVRVLRGDAADGLKEVAVETIHSPLPTLRMAGAEGEELWAILEHDADSLTMMSIR